MLKSIAAGLMCLGFVTLGVAASRGEDEEGKLEVDLTVVGEEQKPASKPSGKAEPKVGNVFEIRIGEEGEATVVGKGEKKNAEGNEGIKVIIQSEDTTLQNLFQEKARIVRAQQRARMTPPAIDPETRQAIEKMIAGLKDEARRLQSEEKKEDAEKKQQSIRALEQLLNPGPRWEAMSAQPGQPGGIRFVVGNPEPGPANDEMKKLHERIQKLQAQVAKTGGGDQEAREKLQRLMGELEKTVAERQRRKMVMAPGANPFGPGAPGAPVAPGTPLPPGGQAWKFQPGAGGAVPGAVFWMAEGGAPEVAELMRKADALTQASAKLKEAGLEQQSRELHEQAEKLRAHAEKIRSKTPDPHGFGPWGAGGFAGGPPAQLQRSIHELQEQVQQLRKEIGELRELLQHKP